MPRLRPGIRHEGEKAPRPLMLGEDVGARVVGEDPGLKHLAGAPDLDT